VAKAKKPHRQRKRLRRHPNRLRPKLDRLRQLSLLHPQEPSYQKELLTLREQCVSAPMPQRTQEMKLLARAKKGGKLKPSRMRKLGGGLS
jgi:hypothetical protein